MKKKKKEDVEWQYFKGSSNLEGLPSLNQDDTVRSMLTYIAEDEWQRIELTHGMG